MNDDPTALLREIRDLLREQTALAQEMRDMHLKSMQRLQASHEQSDQMMARAELLQSQSPSPSQRPLSFSNLVVYGAAIVVVLALFSQLRAFW